MNAEETPVLVGGVVGEYLAQLYGGLFRVVESIVNDFTAVNIIVPRNAERVGLAVINLGPEIVFLSPFNVTTGTAFGIILSAAGGSLTLNLFDDGVLCAGSWFWRPSVGGVNSIYVLETLRDVRLPIIQAPIP